MKNKPAWPHVLIGVALVVIVGSLVLSHIVDWYLDQQKEEESSTESEVLAFTHEWKRLIKIQPLNAWRLKWHDSTPVICKVDGDECPYYVDMKDVGLLVVIEIVVVNQQQFDAELFSCRSGKELAKKLHKLLMPDKTEYRTAGSRVRCLLLHLYIRTKGAEFGSDVLVAAVYRVAVSEHGAAFCAEHCDKEYHRRA